MRRTASTDRASNALCTPLRALCAARRALRGGVRVRGATPLLRCARRACISFPLPFGRRYGDGMGGEYSEEGAEGMDPAVAQPAPEGPCVVVPALSFRQARAQSECHAPCAAVRRAGVRAGGMRGDYTCCGGTPGVSAGWKCVRSSR
eukprot:7384223-Prymnesium_polylepis.1